MTNATIIGPSTVSEFVKWPAKGCYHAYLDTPISTLEYGETKMSEPILVWFSLYERNPNNAVEIAVDNAIGGQGLPGVELERSAILSQAKQRFEEALKEIK